MCVFWPERPADYFLIKLLRRIMCYSGTGWIKSTCSVSSDPPNNVVDLFSDTDCISVPRMLKQPKLQPRFGLCAMINTPLSQSLTSTRATLPVRYTSSQIESSPPFSRLGCNRTWDPTSHRTPILFSFPAIKYYVRADFGDGLQNAFSAFEVNTGINQRCSPLRIQWSKFVCHRNSKIYSTPCALAHHSASS